MDSKASGTHSLFTSHNNYLAQGVNGTLSPTEDDSTSQVAHPVQLENEKFLIDPCLRLNIERLESALKFLGLDPTFEQQSEMRQRLQIESDGTVAYGDFVTLAQEMFTSELPKIKLYSSTTTKTENKLDLSQAMNRLSQDSLSAEVELKWTNREKEKLKFENNRLQGLLHQRDLELKSAENELFQVREELQSTVEECRSLRSRLRLAEEAQKAARRTEQDYEEVLRLLELELLQTSQQESSTKTSKHPARLQELEHELRKTEVEKKMYEVATERLLQFSMLVQEHLDGLLHTFSSENGGVNDSELGRRLSHCSKVINFLAADAKATTKAVKSLLEMENASALSVGSIDQSQQKHEIRSFRLQEKPVHSLLPQMSSATSHSTAKTLEPQKQLKQRMHNEGVS